MRSRRKGTAARLEVWKVSSCLEVEIGNVTRCLGFMHQEGGQVLLGKGGVSASPCCPWLFSYAPQTTWV